MAAEDFDELTERITSDGGASPIQVRVYDNGSNNELLREVECRDALDAFATYDALVDEFGCYPDRYLIELVLVVQSRIIEGHWGATDV